MIDIDTEAHAQLAQRRKKPSSRTAAYRLAAVEEALASKLQGDVYRRHGVSGSTFYFWRCEYVLRRYAESLERQLAQATTEIAALRRRLDDRQLRQPIRIERSDAECRLDVLERQVHALAQHREYAHVTAG